MGPLHPQFPAGLDTAVESDGSGLSEGEKQLICSLRAMLGESRDQEGSCTSYVRAAEEGFTQRADVERELSWILYLVQIQTGGAWGGGQITPDRVMQQISLVMFAGVNKIVILDEATSSLTHSMETRLSGALAEHFRASTVITITHRVSITVL